MKSHLQLFEDFLSEADDPTYYQETFYFTILIVMSKDRGGSRDETKNDIRALPEVLTVTLVEPEKGGVQRDVGPKYLSTLKVHVRKPKGISKDILMKRVVLLINNLRGVTVLRYKERVPKPRRKAFHGRYQITELDYQRERDKKKKQYARMKSRIIAKGPQSPGPPYNEPASTKRGQAIGDAFGAMEEDMVIRVPDTTSPSDLMAFEVRPQLQPQIWDDDQEVHPSIRTALMKIVDEFLESLDLEIDIKDITITGSLANYNWSKYSDIDVHIIVDFEEINENETMVKKFFDAVRSRWNKLHDIRNIRSRG
jgi:predicted nucleotidyltransferase